MYLFILETLGTQELILIGIFALVVFGPRKLPEMARKLGSMLTEFKRVSRDFRSTWEDAVALEETIETKELGSKEHPIEDVEIENTISQNDLQAETGETNGKAELPEIREVSKEEFDDLILEKNDEEAEITKRNKIEEIKPTESKKTSWL